MHPVAKAGMRLMAKAEAWRFRRSKGRAKFRGQEQILLTTLGRKTGKERTNPLFFNRNGDRIVVIASFAGNATDPAWFLNMRERGEAWVELGREKFRVTPRILEGEERERNWQAMAAFWPDYDTYSTKTDRVIPVVTLERV